MPLIFDDFLKIYPNPEMYDRYVRVICPFHNDNDPSLLIFKDGWFRCLGCQRNGNWQTLWNKIKGQPIQVVQESNTQWNGPRLDDDLESLCYQAHRDLIHFPTLQWYLEMRGIEGRIESNELGYWEGWYTIPVRDRDGGFVTAVLRAAPHVQEATRLRYWSHHKPTMFVPDWRLFDNFDYCYIVYGMVDALALADLRSPVVTSTSGNLSFSPSWLDGVRKPIIVIPDKGEEPIALKLAAELGWRGRVLRLGYEDDIKDPAGYLENGKRENLLWQLKR